jgi:transposase
MGRKFSVIIPYIFSKGVFIFLMTALKLDYFSGMVTSINKKLKTELSVVIENGEITLKSKKGRVFGTPDPNTFEKALKSLKKEGTISHYLFEERKEYNAFIKEQGSKGISPKEAHKIYFQNLL